jgi:hypothetical protein
MISSRVAVSFRLWFGADKLAGLRSNHYFLLQTLTHPFSRNVKIEICLQSQPELPICGLDAQII